MVESKTDSTRGLIRAGVFDIVSGNEHLATIERLYAQSPRPAQSPTIAQKILEIASKVPDPDVALAAYAELSQAIAQPDGPASTQGAESATAHTAAPTTTPATTHTVTPAITPADISPFFPNFPQLLTLLGSSEAMGRLMLTRPSMVAAVARGENYESHAWNVEKRKSVLLSKVGKIAGVGEKPFAQAVSSLRGEYYAQLSAIMAWDVTNDPESVQPAVSDALSDLAQAALEAALAIAYSQVEDSKQCIFAIIGMGKLGAHELNYVSDVDLIYVVEPATEDVALQKLLKIGTKLAVTLQKVCMSVIPGVDEPPLWQIDGALRPEGKDGQLVRRLSSHEEYYKSWAKNWEFQALLKARCVAGNAELGAAYEQMAQSFVWQASTRENFVFDCQQMRKRVEKLIPEQLKDREIKLGRGGLRDVEFTVQMLQLVHGRTDESLRTASTLGALQALSEGGYVSRRQAELLGDDYRFERVLEHRAQIWALKRTHLFPDLGEGSVGGMEASRVIREGTLEEIPELRRLARVFGLRPEQLVTRFDATRREVRRLHLDIYYRPMLPQIAQLSEDDIALSASAALERFASIGFADPQAAIRHVEHLTEGISRSAKINRVILPTMLRWLGEGQNPDMGLLTLRKLEESFGQDSEYLGFLRDSLSAGRRLCRVVANSRYLADALTKSVESITWLGSNERLKPRTRESLTVQSTVALRRFDTSMNEFATSIRALRRHEIERIGLAWMNGIIKSSESMRAMTDVYDALLEVSLQWSINHQMQAQNLERPAATLAVIAMGRFGGREVNFSSDADIIVMYEKTEGAEESVAAAFARKVLDEVRTILNSPVSTEPGIDLDLDLRPEGKNGPLLRSYESYREYYQHWASTWEFQALLRARFSAGDKDLGARFLREIADPLRYPESDLNPKQIQEIRKLKARMEAERLPRGVQRQRHLKLGKGGLSDVEWTVQFLQLRHGGHNEKLRTVSTVAALRELRDSGLMTQADEESLEIAWKLTTDARNANFLWQGRADHADILPDDTYSLGGISACMRQGAHRGQEFENELLSAMRHCREVTDRLFYGNEE